MGDHYKAKQFIRAIHGSGGIISTIAKRVGCDWNTAKKYITEYTTVAKAYNAECERINDMAESVVINEIKGGDLSTAKWWISRKRKEEFSERRELSTPEDQPIEIKLIEVVKDHGEEE